jgi:hypothetical protein
MSVSGLLAFELAKTKVDFCLQAVKVAFVVPLFPHPSYPEKSFSKDHYYLSFVILATHCPLTASQAC